MHVELRDGKGTSALRPSVGLGEHGDPKGFPGGATGKELTCQCRRREEMRVQSLSREDPWRRAWQPTARFLPGESHGHRSLVGYSPWDCKESNMTEVTVHTHRDQKGGCLPRNCPDSCLVCRCGQPSLAGGKPLPFLPHVPHQEGLPALG